MLQDVAGQLGAVDLHGLELTGVLHEGLEQLSHDPEPERLFHGAAACRGHRQAAAAGLPAGVGQEPGLAPSHGAFQHDEAAAAVIETIEQAVDGVDLLVALDEKAHVGPGGRRPRRVL